MLGSMLSQESSLWVFPVWSFSHVCFSFHKSHAFLHLTTNQNTWLRYTLVYIILTFWHHLCCPPAMHRVCQSNGLDYSRPQTSPSQSRRKTRRLCSTFLSSTTPQATVVRSTSASHLLVKYLSLQADNNQESIVLKREAPLNKSILDHVVVTRTCIFFHSQKKMHSLQGRSL